MISLLIAGFQMHQFASTHAAHCPGKVEKSRLSSLDGLRGIAILLVIGRHYFDDGGDLYPYGDAFSGFVLFKYGQMGVELFFIISGFVIAMTLETCRTPYEFLVRRFARIWPPLVVCSVITFAILGALWWSPHSVAKHEIWANFLPSLTLTPNLIWQPYFPGVDLVDGVYWSLLIEARFYLIALALYWAVPRMRFGHAVALFTVANILCRAVVQRVLPGSNDIYSAAFVPDFMPWFAAGAVFYDLWHRRIGTWTALMFLFPMLLIIFRTNTFSKESPVVLSAFALIFFAMFWAVSQRYAIVRIFELRPLVLVGLCSYSIYLLHHEIGMAFITSMPGSWPIGIQLFGILIVIAIMVGAGYLSFRFLEGPAGRVVTRSLLYPLRAMPVPVIGS